VKPLLLALPAIGALTFAASGMAAPAEQPGEKIYKARCAACHSVTKGDGPGGMAPNLAGVVGRKAGSSEFKSFSPALKKSGLRWDRKNLDAYLKSPTKTVPGTRMMVSLPDDKQRADVIAFLASQK
jgi:cytochrome c